MCLPGSRHAVKGRNKTPVPATLLAVVMGTKAPRLQRGKHAALKNKYIKARNAGLDVFYLCPEVVIFILGRMGQG